MSYVAAAVANELLARAKRSDRYLTNIDIQKLVYFAHGWSLALLDAPLIVEPIEAWTYGPVVRRLYDAFKRFGSAPITDEATEWMTNSYGEPYACKPRMTSDDPADALAGAVLSTVWDRYGTLGPFKLVEITHLQGSPWDRARKEDRKYISNDEMRVYFKRLASTGAVA